ncbi:MAG: LacI family DNA-binding transcriptional regulator, partial [Bacteroidales bacterium]|nr:LacI family DNA-binding transcriptional regulator [Bacteroidales bacterium]
KRFSKTQVKKVSIKDIADSLKVSKSLVSFVLNGQGNEKGIHTETQRKVIRKARELNYQPNLMARGLRLGKTNTIGLIVADISNKFYAKIARQIEKEAARNNYNLIICSTDEDPARENALIHLLRERQVDGLIISTTQKSTELFSRMKHENYPFVLIDRQLAKINTNYVGVENRDGAFRATRLLIVNGYRKIALFRISPSYLSSVREREQGYRDALKDGNIRVNSKLICEISFSNLNQQVKQALAGLKDAGIFPDAIFTVNNRIAVAILESLGEMDLSIPDDVALISFDDIELFRFSCPSITAIAQPVEEIGQEAVNILLQSINGQVNGAFIRKVLPVRLIERNSSCFHDQPPCPKPQSTVILNNESEKNL